MEDIKKDIQNINEKVENEEKKEVSELEKITKEKDEYLDGWKRAKADLINYKKDEMSRLQEIARFATEDMIRDLIIVLDSFNLGILALEDEKESKSAKGMYMIRNQLEEVLKKKGLEKISVSVGDKFDPNVHEAIASVDSEIESGNIVEEVEKGYFLHGKLLRPSMVKVAK